MTIHDQLLQERDALFTGLKTSALDLLRMIPSAVAEAKTVITERDQLRVRLNQLREDMDDAPRVNQLAIDSANAQAANARIALQGAVMEHTQQMSEIRSRHEHDIDALQGQVAWLEFHLESAQVQPQSVSQREGDALSERDAALIGKAEAERALDAFQTDYQTYRETANKLVQKPILMAERLVFAMASLDLNCAAEQRKGINASMMCGTCPGCAARNAMSAYSDLRIEMSQHGL